MSSTKSNIKLLDKGKIIMDIFIQETLKPQIFWTALASIGTLLAILVALFMPTFTQYFKNKRIEKLFLAELKGNLQVIKNMTSREDRTLPNNHRVSAIQNNNALVSHIDLRLWHQYRYELAASRPDLYENFHSVYRFAEAILDSQENVPNEAMRLMLQTDEASSFVSTYEEIVK